MILFVLYLFIILWLINRNGFFGLMNDSVISKTQFAWLFFFKALAVPVFYLVYKNMYGGIEQLDAGKFFSDAKVIGNYAFQDPLAYLRIMLGFQNDAENSADYIHVLKNTVNWDNGEFKDYLYNDNRVVIRIHALFYFVCFDSYFAHALLNCLFGFFGIVLIYKSVKEFFSGRELLVLFVLCFFPALWFYTGAVLKESIAIFITGGLVYFFKSLITSGFGLKKLTFAILFLLIALFIKPYLILFVSFCFVLFFVLHYKSNIKFKLLVFVMVLAFVFMLGNLFSIAVKKKSVYTAISNHQKVFSDVAEGGIFLEKDSVFIRLKYDLALIRKSTRNDSIYTIKAGVPYVYWNLYRIKDTLFCEANKDSLTEFKLRYIISHSNSNLNTGKIENGVFLYLVTALNNSLFYPLFYNANGPLQFLASLENLILILSLILVITGIIIRRKIELLPFVFVFITLGICILTGIATPNGGAIFRYRSPAVIYILLAAVYYLPFPIQKKENSF